MLAAAHQHQKNASLRVSVCALSRALTSYFLFSFLCAQAGKRPKKKYGHFPNDWMLGESCWPAFRDRVQRQYNYSRYTCHQTTIDGLHRGKFEQCAAEAERLCVRPFCTPRITIVSFPSGQNTPTSVAKPATHPLPHPPPRLSHEDLAAAAEAAGQRTIYPGPKLVMLGCEGCGVPELWRTLVAARPPGGRLQVALVNQGEPAWRDRQVHFFDHESRFIYGSSWYFGRWPHVVPTSSAAASSSSSNVRDTSVASPPAAPLGVDGSGTYLASPDAAIRLGALLPPSTTLLVVLRDPALRAARRWRELQRRAEYARAGMQTFEARVLAEAEGLVALLEKAASEGSNGGGGGVGLAANAWDSCVATVCARALVRYRLWGVSPTAIRMVASGARVPLGGATW